VFLSNKHYPNHHQQEIMKINTLVLTAATFAAFALTTTGAFAWGCSRSCSASTRGGGSVSHTSGSAGGYGGYAHGGSTTVTGREGNSYTTAHASAVGYGGGAYHGAAYGGTAYHGAAYGGAVYHTGGYGAVSYGGCYSTGVGVGVVAAAPVYAPPVVVEPAAPVVVAPAVEVYHPPVVAAAAVYHPYTPYTAGVYHRTVAFRR
jgi:hypothetical protein